MPTKIRAAQLAKVVEVAELGLKGVRRRLKTAEPTQLAKDLKYAESVLAGVRRALLESVGRRGTEPTFELPGPFLATGHCQVGLPKSVAKNCEIHLPGPIR